MKLRKKHSQNPPIKPISNHHFYAFVQFKSAFPCFSHFFSHLFPSPTATIHRPWSQELKALLQRERHDHAVELGQLIERLRDQERRRPGLPMLGAMGWGWGDWTVVTVVYRWVIHHGIMPHSSFIRSSFPNCTNVIFFGRCNTDGCGYRWI